jgi:integrase
MPSKSVGVHPDDLGVPLGVSVVPQESDTPKMVLTDTKIRNLKSKGKPYKVADFDGLHVLVKPSGSKLWRFKYRILGKEKLLAIGSYPAISLLDARIVRDEARREVARGNDPSQMKREKALVEKEGIGQTFEKISEMYLSKIEKEDRASATMVKNRWYLGMAIAAFGRKPITEITSPVVLRCLRVPEAKGHFETARRLRSTIGSVFRYAIAVGVAEHDPTFALRDALIRPTVVSRAAITDKNNLGGLMRVIDGFQGQPTTRIALEILAIVVTRPGELRHAKWGEFDFDERVWSIPASRMKMRFPHKVPLPNRALELLLQLQELTGYGELLFPSIRSSKRPMSENTLNASLRRMGYSGDEMTAHGFRASFSTLANESGLWNPDAIERALAHVEKNEVRRAYARGEHWEERVRLADWWAGLLEELQAGYTNPSGF